MVFIFKHNFTDKSLNILFKFVCCMRNVSKIKKIECSHNQVEKLVLSACYVTYKKSPLNIYLKCL